MPSIEDKPYMPVTPTAVTDPGFSWLGLLGMMMFFFIILLACLWLLRNLKKTNFGIGNSKWVRVLDRQPLGGQQMLYLVEVAGKLQVLGGSEHTLVKISEIEDPDTAAEILADLASRPYEQDGAIIPNLFEKLYGFKVKRQNFSAELEDLIKEAKDEDFEEDK